MVEQNQYVFFWGKNPSIPTVGILSEISPLHVLAVSSLSSVHSLTQFPSQSVHIITHTYVQTVCALACAPLLFLDFDTKCYGPNWGARGMLSPILSLSVPLDALQAREDGLGDCAMCPSSIIYEQFTPSPLLNYCTLSSIVCTDQ